MIYKSFRSLIFKITGTRNSNFVFFFFVLNLIHTAVILDILHRSETQSFEQWEYFRRRVWRRKVLLLFDPAGKGYSWHVALRRVPSCLISRCRKIRITVETTNKKKNCVVSPWWYQSSCANLRFGLYKNSMKGEPRQRRWNFRIQLLRMDFMAIKHKK